MLKILFDPYTLSIIAYISLLVTVYFSAKIRHKKIFYRIMKKDNSCIIFFWNPCFYSIQKEDIYYFYCLISEGSTISMYYATDKEIPLLFKDVLTSPENDSNNRARKMHRINILFDFMNHEQGYYLKIDKTNNTNYLPLNAEIHGRIKGERPSYFHMYTPDDVEPFWFMDIFTLCGVLTYIYNINYIIEEKSVELFVCGLSFLLLTHIIMYIHVLLNRVPPVLNYRMKKFQQMGYKYINEEQPDYKDRKMRR